MEMPFPPASSQKSLEEELSQCVAEVLTKKNLTIFCARGAATEPAMMRSPPGSEASPGSCRQRGFKCVTPRESTEKMRPRHGAITKHHRQQRQTSKGPLKIYPANVNNFKNMVYEHTSMRTSSPMVDVTAQPTSPLTPHSTSNSSAWGVTSQPSSPVTPHSIQSSAASPLTSPQSGYLSGYPINGTNVKFFQLPSLVQSEVGPPFNTHLTVPPTHSHHDSALALDCNTNHLNQNHLVPRCASMPCLGISSEAGNDPFNNGRPYSTSPKQPASQFSLEKFLNMSPERNQSMSPRSYEKQLSWERMMNEPLWLDGGTVTNNFL